MGKSKFSTNELTDGMMSGQLSRRRFHQILGAAGVSLVMTPAMSRMAKAAAADQAPFSHGVATTIRRCLVPISQSMAIRPIWQHSADRKRL
jgi:hypothetical protein